MISRRLRLVSEGVPAKAKGIPCFTGGNAARATELLDIGDELQLISDYEDWASDNENGNPDYESSMFP